MRVMILVLLCAVQSSLSAEKRAYQMLIDELFYNYSSVVRPVINESQPTEVLLELKIIKLLDLDTRNEFIRLLCWYTEIWYDQFLYWDPKLHKGLEYIFVTEADVWKPDTSILEMLTMNLQEATRPQPVRIDTIFEEKRSVVRIARPIIYEFSLKIQVQYFPYDIQTVKATVTSWTRDGTEIIYKTKPLFTDYYNHNLQWRLTNATSGEAMLYYKLQQRDGTYREQPFSEVYWTLEFQRKADFFFITLVVPTALLVEVCFLGIFTLSQSDGCRTEKVTLGITTILAISILMLVVGDIIPRASKPRPRINRYFMCQMILICTSLVASQPFIYLYFYCLKFEKPIPKFIKAILCLNCCARTKKCDHDENTNDARSDPKRSHQRNNDWKMDSDLPNVPPVTRATIQHDSEMSTLKEEVTKIKTIVEKLRCDIMDEQNRHKDLVDDWDKTLGAVEVICFVYCSLLNFLITLHFVLDHPAEKPSI